MEILIRKYHALPSKGTHIDSSILCMKVQSATSDPLSIPAPIFLRDDVWQLLNFLSFVLYIPTRDTMSLHHFLCSFVPFSTEHSDTHGFQLIFLINSTTSNKAP